MYRRRNGRLFETIQNCWNPEKANDTCETAAQNRQSHPAGDRSCQLRTGN